MVDLSDCFEIDDEAVYSEWQFLSLRSPIYSFVGLNLEPDEHGCEACREGRCMQRVDTSDSWGVAHVLHHYDKHQS